MRVLHTIPTGQSRRHERSVDCPCQPSQTVSAAPGEQPAVTITHHPIKTTRSTR